MKSFFALICLCLASNSFGQIINSGDPSPNLLNFVASSHDLLETYEVEEAEDAVDITTDYWDTSKIRVDYGKDIKFPIHLQFNNSNYASPISKNKVITSRYGWRKGRAHKGIDIDLVTGDSLFAMFDGVVRFANYSSGHGRSVVVRHFNGLETAYAHLSSYGVKENDSVVAGSYLGKGGTSGNARGSHLHLEVSYQGIQINPEYLLQFNDSNEVLNNEIWITRDMTRPELHNSKRKGTIDVPTTESEAIALANKPKTVYIVKRGDTLSRISSRSNMSLAALCKLNGINKNATLKIGQKLIVI
ncbi:peptidoglycan DD-metalloendopeptidase family protein [Bizionia hallyeonensis]|uniref:Peptidoglycan DD-metalloendopeptidase family protein n=1 Tax=Bizionia hallyeonensis TaxID=1123757 RepID=A0ABW0C5U3_9FLAO